MAKDDVPAPPHPSRKRRVLEDQGQTPDLWLAIWANDEKLSPSERRRVQEERDRRKALDPDRIVGVLVDAEDCTPAQLARLREELQACRPTAIHHPWTTRRIASACRTVAQRGRSGQGGQSGEIPLVRHRELRDVVVNSTMVVVAPRKPEDFRNRTPAWEAAKYARHRNLPVTVVLPDGTTTRDPLP